MPVYRYKGLDSQGKGVKGIIDAETPKAARQKLRSQRIFPKELVEERGGRGSAPERPGLDLSQYFGRVKPQEIAIMTRQLATLVGANLPVVSALTALSEQVESDLLKRVITQVRERVNEGSSLAEAMRRYPRVFSDLYVNMIAAGESSGALDIVLGRLADFIEGQVALRNKIRATMAYPTVMLFLSIGILSFLMTVVIPKITRLFATIKQALPLPTVVMIAVSNFTRDYWWLILTGLVVGIVGLRRYVKTPKGRERFDRLKLKLPLFGPLIQKIAVSRFSRTLATLLASGLPLVKALDIVKTIVNNVILARAIEEVREDVTEGASLSGPLKETKVFPPIIIHMIAIGEQTGHLEEMLAKVSDAYDNEVEAAITGLTSLIEPLMIVFMGGIVGFIVLSILLPMLELTSGISS